MGKTASKWWSSQIRQIAQFTLATGAALSLFALTCFHFLQEPEVVPDTGRQLSNKSKDSLSETGKRMAPLTVAFALRWDFALNEHNRSNSDRLDDDEIIDSVSELADVAEFVARKLNECSGSAARSDGVLILDAQRYLAKVTREKCQLILDSGIFEPGVNPVHLKILGSPTAIAATQAGRVEQIMERIIRRLLRVLNRIPTQSRGSRGIQRAILAIRRLLRFCDTTPVDVTFTAPADGVMVTEVPDISFVLEDSGSGPDPISLQLIAETNIQSGTALVDLSSFLAISTIDQINGVLVVEATGIPNSIFPDGEIRLVASGADFAGNSSTAEIMITIDTGGPEITVLRPSASEIEITNTVQFDISISDSGSGLEESSLSVLLDGVEILSQLTSVVVETNANNSPTLMRVSESLQVVEGTHTLFVNILDKSQREAQLSLQFTVTPNSLFKPRTFPAVSLEQVIDVPPRPGQDPPGEIKGPITTLSKVVKIKATLDGGEVAEGIGISPRIVQGEGAIVPDDALPMVTGPDGVAGFRVAFGRRPGEIKIEVEADSAIANSALELQGFAEEMPFSATVLSGAEPPGSADVVIIGAPAFTRFRVFESTSDGTEIQIQDQKLEMFDPEVNTRASEEAFPIASGIAVAGFVIKSNSSGTTYVTIEAIGVEDPQGELVSETIQYDIQSNANAKAVVSSGQGQRAFPGFGTKSSLVASLTPNSDPGPIVFSVLSPTILNGASYPGEFIVTSGTDPVLSFDGSKISITPVGGQAGLIYKPALPISVLIGIGQGTTNDTFLVAAPKISIVRKSFQRDADGDITFDNNGNPIPDTNSAPFEEVPQNGPEPFIRVSKILGSDQAPTEPSETYRFYLEIETGEFGQTLPGGVMSTTPFRTALDIADGIVSSEIDVDLAFVQTTGTTTALYRSGPIALTMLTSATANESIASTLPGNVQVIQGDMDSSVYAFVPFFINQDEKKIPMKGRPANSPVWMFLGDSVSMGTQALCVVKQYQRASYAVRVCQIAGVFERVPAISEPGAPVRVWVDPLASDPNLPDTESEPNNNPTLFPELALYKDKYGTRTKESLYLFTNVLGIDGFEIRQAITNGRFSPGVTRTLGQFNANSKPYLRSDFRFEEVGGLEKIGYWEWSNTEVHLTQHALVKNFPRDFKPRDASQIEHARLSRADMISIFLGNNDTLQAVLNGSTITAWMTPTDTFTLATHKSELKPLQSIRSSGAHPGVPRLFDDPFPQQATDKIGVISFKDALDKLITDLKEIDGQKQGSKKKPDILITRLPDSTQIPILIKLKEGQSLRDALGDENRPPFRIVLFGIDLTADLLDGVILSTRIRDHNKGLTKEEFLEGSSVSLEMIFFELQRAIVALARNIGDEIVGRMSMWEKGGLFLDANAAVKVRKQVRDQLTENWVALYKGAILGAKNKFAFRQDQVLTPDEINDIKTRIGVYNGLIDGVAEESNDQIHTFDLFALFKNASTNAGFDVLDKAGNKFDTMKSTWRGKLFSLDGAHPGSFGHIVIASEMMERMKQIAAARAKRRFGGVVQFDLSRVDKLLLEKVRDDEDQAIKGASKNQ